MKKRITSSLLSCRNKSRFFLDHLVDRYIGIDTAAWFIYPKEKSLWGDSQSNVSISYWLLYKYIDCLKLSSEDIFYDIGCGYGRVLCLVARKRISKCVGIEISAEFAAKALENAKTMRHRVSPIEIRIGDAVEMDYMDGTVFHLSNPFGAKTLRTVLARIEQTLTVNPRRLRFIYVNPVHKEIFASTKWLKYSGENRVFFSPLVASYWTYGA